MEKELCVRLVIYKGYNELHCQQNINILYVFALNSARIAGQECDGFCIGHS